jgi:AcrR family transcriptional regulator
MTQSAKPEQGPPKKAKQQRRSQAERSEAMRSRLASAAYQTVANGGLNALRLRSVAEAAGVSQGALLHHFPDKNAVVLAAIETALELARQDSEEHLASSLDGREALLRAMLAEFRDFFFSDRFWVAIGITIETVKDDKFFSSVRSRVAALRKPVYDAWEERLIAGGWTERQAARDVRGGAAIVSGLAIRRFWADPDNLADEIIDEWISDRLTR